MLRLQNVCIIKENIDLNKNILKLKLTLKRKMFMHLKNRQYNNNRHIQYSQNKEKYLRRPCNSKASI